MRQRSRLFAALLSSLVGTAAIAQTPLGSDFKYQGELVSNGSPATGQFDLVFRLFDAANAGTQIGPTLCVNDLLVDGGKFTASLDFGAVFGTQQRFLEVAVRDGNIADCSNSGGYVTLLPRQLVAATPAAQFATQANASSTLGGQPRSFFQNASNLTTGTLPDARLSTNIARVDAASNTFTGGITAPTFTGTLVGNASTATNATSATNAANALNASNAANLNNQPASFYLNATNINAGTLADARLSTNIPRLNATNTLFDGDLTSNGNLDARGSAGLLIRNPTNILVALQGLWQTDIATLRVSGSGAGSLNGFRISTPGDANAVRILDDGSMGIGTSTPEAPLHVRGGGSMGGIIVTPDVTDTASQLVLCENTTASNGMYVRYNGVTNNLEFGGRAADVETAAHLTVNRDSGAVVIDPATATGDSSLVVPAGSISALETGNEAGVASASSTTAVTLPVQTSTTVDSVTITAPTSGKVVVYATVQYSNPDSREQIIRSVISTSSVASATAGYATNLKGFNVLANEAYPECLTIHKTFTVVPGATTFYLRARPLNDAPVSFSPPTADDIALTAMFFPTTY
ncbi:MAG: hypothetical protein U0640_06395 [Phycisphaerales bacterium]